MPSGNEPLAIVALGHEGDGRVADGSYVPFALPGERVVPRANAAPEIIEASPDRAAPACRHFTQCGGCRVQHLAAAPYAAWKRETLIRTLQQRGLETDVHALAAIAPGTRRRAALSAIIARDKSLTLGFTRASSTLIVDVEECPLVDPRIAAALPGLRRLIAALTASGRTRVSVLASDTGLDVDIATSTRAERSLDRTRRTQLADLAATFDLARLSLAGEPFVERRKPILAFDGIAVAPPPGAFVQAVAAAEETLRARVLEWLAGAKRIADLFAGLGTFALPLARRAAVTAVEGEEGALAALTAAARATPGLKPVTAERRDLFRRPLSARELDRFDAVVLDPPRQGAVAQIEHLAKAKTRRIAYVSCDAATFARDARVLVDGGFALVEIQPVDQFLWSPELELVARFERM
ncbi:MAG: RNA methyltransferase [Alphaproteobacteria bacterium]|nr:RNA methyltransferase [Alphaproteobacteria bacterium]